MVKNTIFFQKVGFSEEHLTKPSSKFLLIKPVSLSLPLDSHMPETCDLEPPLTLLSSFGLVSREEQRYAKRESRQKNRTL